MAKSKFLRNLASKELLVPHLDAWFATNDFPDEIPFTLTPNKEKDDALHPSMHALACPREIYAEKMGHMDEPTKMALAQTNKMFFFGDFTHKLLQWIIVEQLRFATWDDIEHEVYLESKTEKGNAWQCRGFVDVAHCIIPNVGDRLIDMKTTNARVFATQIPHALWQKYVAQVNLYMDWTGQTEEEAIILVIEKDHPHRFKELYIPFDPDLVDDVYERWDAATDAVAEGKPPECWCDIQPQCPVSDLYDGVPTT